MTVQPDYRDPQVGLRPLAITVICVIALVGAVFTVIGGIYLLSAGADSLVVLPSWYWVFLAASSVIGLISFVGLWLMKKWGLYLYTAGAAIAQIVLITTGLWTIVSLIMPLIVIIVGFLYVSRMT